MANRGLDDYYRRRDNVLQMPIVQDAMRRGFTGELKIPGTDIKVKMTQGQNPMVGSGGIWKPLLAAGAVATGGLLAGAAMPGALFGSGGGMAGVGPVAAAGGTTSATVPSALAAGGAGASGAASLFKNIAQGVATAAPAIPLLMNRGGGSDGMPGGPQDAQMNEILEMMKRRLGRTEPVHEAAMRMAQSMAPTGASNPRMAQAIQMAGQPMAQPPMNPQISEAIARLMGGR